jgi:hypothetical protein
MNTFKFEEGLVGANAYPITYTINNSGCWICISHARSKKGYPKIKRNSKNLLMSRYIWTYLNGEIQEENHVLHKCDNPACINPDHLFLGTNFDNIKDKVSKNRQAKHSSLTEKDVFEIKTNTKDTSAILSKIYNVSSTTIMRIWREEIYSYVKVDDYQNIVFERNKRIRSKKSLLSH